MNWDDGLVFRVVTEELSFTGAAERLRISQPAVSQRVRRLERQLGLRLLRRSTRKMALTEAGQIVLAGVCDMQRTWEIAGERLQMSKPLPQQAGTARLPLIAWDDSNILRVVAEEGSFLQAAVRLHVSRRAVSERVRRVERRLKLCVFIRERRGLRLTPAGHLLIDALCDVTAVWDRILHHLAMLSGVASSGRPPLRLAVSSTAQITLLPRLRTAFPDHEVTLVVQPPQQAIALLAEGEVDAAFTCDAPGQDVKVAPPLQGETLVEEPIWIMVGCAHRLASRGTVPPGDLADESWVVWENGWAQSFVRALGARWQFVPRMDHVVDHIDAMTSLVRTQRAIAPMHASSRVPLGLAVVRLSETITCRSVLIRSAQLADAMHRRLRTVIAQHVSDRVAEAPHFLDHVLAHPGDYGAIIDRLPTPALPIASATQPAGNLAQQTLLRVASYSLGVADLAAKLKQSLPTTSIATTTTNPRHALQQLEHGDVDLAIGYSPFGHLPPVGPDTVLDLLLDEPVCVALATDHRLANGPTVALADLAADAWIAPPPNAPLFAVFTQVFAAASLDPTVVHTTDSAPAIRDFITSGQAVSLASPLAGAIADTQVRIVPIHPPAYRHVWAAWRRQLPTSTRITALSGVCHHYRDLALTAGSLWQYLNEHHLLHGPQWHATVADQPGGSPRP